MRRTTNPAKLRLKIYKALERRRTFDKDSLKLLAKRLGEKEVRRPLVEQFHNRGGKKFINRLTSFVKWVWKYREEIMRALGLVVVLLDDGTHQIKDAAEHEAEQGAKSKPKRKPRKKKEKPDLGIVNEPKPVQLDSPEEADGQQSEQLHEVGGESDSDAAPVPGSDVVQEIPVAEDGSEH